MGRRSLTLILGESELGSTGSSEKRKGVETLHREGRLQPSRAGVHSVLMVWGDCSKVE